MRVLAHVHTFNDADIIDRIIEAVRQQTRPVDEILVVDNASTDGTLDRPSLRHATILRHPENRGTSGTVYTGFCYALEHDYDWIWVFDADSAPEPDALEKLLDLYANWPQSLKDETAFVACLHYDAEDGVPRHGGVFTCDRFRPATPAPDEYYYPCHVNIWSGCLYRLAAVRQIGLPNPNYVLDWGEAEYGYRVMKAGYKCFIHQGAALTHNIRGYGSQVPIEVTRGGTTVTIRELPPIRCYYSCRNGLYFLLYDSAERRFGLLIAVTVRLFVMTANFLLRPRNHGEHITACVRGLWHGVTGNMAVRY